MILEPGIWHTHNFCSTMSRHDKYRSNIITPLCKDSGSHGSSVILGISVRYLWKGCRTGKGRGLKGTSKRPEGDLAPSQGHNQHCSTINPSLLYYFQIIFKWEKSLWSIKTLLNPPPPPSHFNGGRAILSGWGWQRLRATLRRWSGMATGQCENCDTGEGQQT